MSSKAPAIGIDLGTTYSCVAIYRNGDVETIANEQGNRTTPSIVAFNEVERLIGETADEEMIMNPTNVIRDVKRLIGRDIDDPKVQANMKNWSYEVVSSDTGKLGVQVCLRNKIELFSPEQISAMILEKMKNIAEVYLNKKVEDAVISIPAHFNDAQRQATMNAGVIAGLNVLSIIKEPTAAALAYGLDRRSNSKRNVLIFDLGGGTFDVSILSIQGTNFKVEGYGGDTNLGGEDFNNNMIEYFVQEFEQKYGVSLKGNRSARARLRIACEKAKRILTTATNARILIENLHESKDLDSKMTQSRFEYLNAKLFGKTILCVEDALKAANMDKRSIDEIVLVGGSTRIPKIQSMLKDFFDGKELLKSIHQDEAVAYGAAVQAALISDNLMASQSKTIELKDVLPLSLGTSIIGGITSIIIPRNTPIPAKFTERYSTTVDNQTSCFFAVLEGERTMVIDNNLLGNMTLNEIPPMPRGKAEMDVTFFINANGSLHAEAVETSTGTSTHTTIQYGGKRLNESDMSRMIFDAQRLRINDQKEMENAQARNELERYCFDMLSEVSQNSVASEKCHETLNWLKNTNPSKDSCRTRKNELEVYYFNHM